MRVQYKGTICNRYSSTNHSKIVEGEAGPPKYATSLTAQITQPHLQIYNRATVQLTFLFQMYRIFYLTLEVETVSMENIARMVHIQTRTLIH